MIGVGSKWNRGNNVLLRCHFALTENVKDLIYSTLFKIIIH